MLGHVRTTWGEVALYMLSVIWVMTDNQIHRVSSVVSVEAANRYLHLRTERDLAIKQNEAIVLRRVCSSVCYSFACPSGHT